MSKRPPAPLADTDPCRTSFEVAAPTHDIPVERFKHLPGEYKFSHAAAMYSLWRDAWRAALTSQAGAAVAAGWFLETAHHDGSRTISTVREGVADAFQLYRSPVAAAAAAPVAVDAEARRTAVARAICIACEEVPDHAGDARGNAFRWQDYLPAADAAIAAY